MIDGGEVITDGEDNPLADSCSRIDGDTVAAVEESPLSDRRSNIEGDVVAHGEGHSPASGSSRVD